MFTHRYTFTSSAFTLSTALATIAAALVAACGGSGGGKGGSESADGMVCSTGAGPQICIEKTTFAAGEPITVYFKGGPALPKDWIAIYPGSCCDSTCPSGSTLWEYCMTDTHSATSAGVASGSVVIGASGNPSNWPLAGGTWDLLYLSNDGYTPMARLSIQVDNSGKGATGSCGHSASSSSGCSSDGDCSSSCSNDCYQCLSGSCSCGSEDSYGVCTF